MQKTVLNFRVIIEPYKDDSGKSIYTAFCPTLGVADWGDTIEQALSHIKEGIKSYLKSLVKHKESIPTPDKQEFLVANTSVSLSL